jgi:hypothetical protein
MPSRLKQFALFVAVFLVLVAALFLLYAVDHFGGLGEVLQLPAVLDRSTPAMQDGFDLVAVMRGRPDDSDFSLPSGAKMFLAAQQTSGDTVLWISPPQLPPLSLFDQTRRTNETQLQHFFSVTMVSSAGDHFRAAWYYEGGCLPDGGEPCVASRTGTTRPDLIAVVIPAGYPEDVSYFDVSIRDRLRHHAQWRVERLPRMKSTITPTAQATFCKGGATIILAAVRTPNHSLLNGWPTVRLNLTMLPLAKSTRHMWEFTPSINYGPSLSWESYRQPWMTGDDANVDEEVGDDWLLSHQKLKTGVTTTITSPYVRGNDTAVYHGVLSQFVSRQDSIDIRNVRIDTIEATESGMKEDTYCLDDTHKLDIISGSGLTIFLPKQHKTTKRMIFMSPNSLNLIWRLSPMSPGRSAQTAGMLPDSPLCRNYNRPVTVWFEAFVNGKPLGYLDGLPVQPSNGNPEQVHFPASLPLPNVIKDLKITIHQRLDLQRIPVTLSAKIVNIAQKNLVTEQF